MRKAQTIAQACGMFAALCVLVFAAAALAQSPGSAAKPNSTIPEKQHMGPVDPPTATSDGVITPKADTDPGMTKQPPPQDPNETPVIPPPTGTGGAPGTEAK
ncbi:MAG: hypothetical protein WBD42_02855 [Methylovirgula sp.]